MFFLDKEISRDLATDAKSFLRKNREREREREGEKGEERRGEEAEGKRKEKRERKDNRMSSVRLLPSVSFWFSFRLLM